MVDFLILYELKNRELESIILLGNELKERGFTVEYCKYPIKDIYIFPGMKKKARVVVTSALYDNHSLYVMVYRGMRVKNKVVNLQWEQIWTNKANSDYTDFRFPQQLAKNAVHICWGDHTKEKLKKSGIEERKLAVTGPLQMDLLNKSFKTYYLSKKDLFEKYQINKNNSTILFISSFSYASLTMEEVKGLKSDLDADTVDNFRQISIDSQVEVLKWFDSLLSENKSVNIIYRRHPAENNNEILKKMEEKYANFKVISEMSVKQWILVCDKIYTWYSTSVGEIYFADKSCAILRPIKFSTDMEVSIMNNAYTIESYNSFKRSLSFENFGFPIEKKVMNEYYSVSNQVASYEKTADLLEKVLKTDHYDMQWSKEVIKDFNKNIWKERIKLPVLKLFYIIVEFFIKLRKQIGYSRTTKVELKLNKYKQYKEKIHKEIISNQELELLSNKLKEYAYSKKESSI